jgi:hypothetical protein
MMNFKNQSGTPKDRLSRIILEHKESLLCQVMIFIFETTGDNNAKLSDLTKTPRVWHANPFDCHEVSACVGRDLNTSDVRCERRKGSFIFRGQDIFNSRLGHEWLVIDSGEDGDKIIDFTAGYYLFRDSYIDEPCFQSSYNPIISTSSEIFSYKTLYCIKWDSSTCNWKMQEEF